MNSTSRAFPSVVIAIRFFLDAKALCVKQGHQPARLLVSGGPTAGTTLGRIAKLGAPKSGPRLQALRGRRSSSPRADKGRGEKGKELPVEGIPRPVKRLDRGAKACDRGGTSCGSGLALRQRLPRSSQGVQCGSIPANSAAHWLALPGRTPRRGCRPGQSQTVIPATGFPSPASHFDHRDSMNFQTVLGQRSFHSPTAKFASVG